MKEAWTGIMGYNSDELPSVGQVPGREGVWVAGGFEGHGMPIIYLTMRGVAEMIVKGRGFEEVGIPRVFRTTRERLDSGENVLVEMVEKGEVVDV